MVTSWKKKRKNKGVSLLIIKLLSLRSNLRINCLVEFYTIPQSIYKLDVLGYSFSSLADSAYVVPFKKLFTQSGFQYQELIDSNGTELTHLRIN